MNELRAAIVAEARTWVGTNYMHQQRMKGVGVDCAGLLIGIMRKLDLCAPDFDVTGYLPTPDGSLKGYLDTHLVPIRYGQMDVGDVILVRWVVPQHVGVIGNYAHGGLSMIHAFSNPNGKGSVIEHVLDESMLKRLVAVYRFPKVEE